MTQSDQVNRTLRVMIQKLDEIFTSIGEELFETEIPFHFDQLKSEIAEFFDIDLDMRNEVDADQARHEAGEGPGLCEDL